MSHVSESHANAIAQGSPTQGASDLRQCPFLSLSALSRWALQLCLRKMCLGFPSLPHCPWDARWVRGASLSLCPPGHPHLSRGAGERFQAAPRMVSLPWAGRDPESQAPESSTHLPKMTS